MRKRTRGGPVSWAAARLDILNLLRCQRFVSILFDSGLRFPQPFDFRIHAIEELLHRIHAQLTALVAVERKADSHMFGQLQQHGLVGLFVGGLRGESCERLLQSVLRANGQRTEPRLKCGHFHARFGVLARLAELRK